MSDPASTVRAFLDANILYSAAISTGLRALWRLPGVTLVTSEYALAEAHTNLRADVEAGEWPESCLDALALLAASVEVHPSPTRERAPVSWTLNDPDDVPILLAAIELNCAFLITGDARCFGAWFDRGPIDGVQVIRPAAFLQQFRPVT